MASIDDPLLPERNNRRNIPNKKFDTNLSVPMGNKSRNKSSPDLYDELLPKQSAKDNVPPNEPYMQNLKRIREHHQLIMIFIIGGITHSEIK